MLESIFASLQSFVATSDAHSPVVLLLLLFFGTFLSEDLACIAAGNLAASGRLDILSATVACFLGILVGDILVFLSGRLAGAKLQKTKLFRRFISPEKSTRATEFLNREGASAVFVSRFVSGLRLPTYFAAGLLGTNFAKFVLYFVLAGAVWTPLLVGAATLGQTLIPTRILLGTLAAFFIARFLFKLTSWKNRRLFYGRLIRITNWEFWPLAVFYLPMAIYILRLALRYQSLTVFTAANPGILAGGFVGESKDEIYKLVERSSISQKHLLRHARIPAFLSIREKIQLANDFIETNGLSFPVVLKPDRGERGTGVVVVRSADVLGKLLGTADVDLILQEYIGGVEASVFYYRFPAEKHGNIFSVTEKKFPSVTGDGVSSLEALILKDDRAVSLSKSYFDQNRSHLLDIPAAGEQIQLINIGTHSKGAVFLEGSWLNTSLFERKIDEICREIPGFNFGRFDLRADSFEKLQNAEDFKIIELNGVTSESTNIYDPRYSLLDAYRILFRQWSIAFQIGQANKKGGITPFPFLKLVGLIFFGPNKTQSCQRTPNQALKIFARCA